MQGQSGFPQSRQVEAPLDTTWAEFLKAASPLWRRRLEVLQGAGCAVFTYSELVALWGVSKNGVFIKVNEWARKYPKIVWLERGEKPRAPTHVHFNFALPPTEAVPDAVQVREKTHQAIQETGAALDTMAQTVSATAQALEGLGEQAQNLEELAELDYPDFISEKVYDQTITRLQNIGVTWEHIIWEELAWNPKSQSGRLKIQLKSPDGTIVAIGIFQNGWLINNLAITAK